MVRSAIDTLKQVRQADLARSQAGNIPAVRPVYPGSTGNTTTTTPAPPAPAANYEGSITTFEAKIRAAYQIADIGQRDLALANLQQEAEALSRAQFKA